MKRLLGSAEILTVKPNLKEEIVASFNSDHCVTFETSIIIVGTITPPKGCGYFYTSPYN